MSAAMSSCLPSPQLSLRRYGASPGSHAHAHFQVLWGWHGALELEIEGRGTRMTAGRVAVIPPGARHDFWAGEGGPRRSAQCFVLDTADEALEPLAGRVIEAAPALPRLFEFLQAQDAVLMQAAVPLLLQSLCAGVHDAPHAARGRRIDWAALQAWVDAHLAEPIDVARLAAQAHLSLSQFAARCVAQWGMPPLAWVRERRLAAARRWRRQGLAVAEVALRCGYRSPSALTAALRRAG
jgi:AraC-like DNA-binding protein